MNLPCDFEHKLSSLRIFKSGASKQSSSRCKSVRYRQVNQTTVTSGHSCISVIDNCAHMHGHKRTIPDPIMA